MATTTPENSTASSLLVPGTSVVASILQPGAPVTSTATSEISGTPTTVGKFAAVWKGWETFVFGSVVTGEATGLDREELFGC